jgi:hypothetical protein
MCEAYETPFNPPVSGEVGKEEYLQLLEVFNEDMVDLWKAVSSDPHYSGTYAYCFSQREIPIQLFQQLFTGRFGVIPSNIIFLVYIFRIEK